MCSVKSKFFSPLASHGAIPDHVRWACPVLRHKSSWRSLAVIVCSERWGTLNKKAWACLVHWAWMGPHQPDSHWKFMSHSPTEKMELLLSPEEQSKYTTSMWRPLTSTLVGHRMPHICSCRPVTFGYVYSKLCDNWDVRVTYIVNFVTTCINTILWLCYLLRRRRRIQYRRQLRWRFLASELLRDVAVGDPGRVPGYASPVSCVVQVFKKGAATSKTSSPTASRDWSMHWATRLFLCQLGGRTKTWPRTGSSSRSRSQGNAPSDSPVSTVLYSLHSWAAR